MIRTAIAQINPTVGDIAGNLRKIIENIARAKSLSADIVVFPELALCGYPPEDLLFKKHFIDDNLQSLCYLIKETKGVNVIVGFVDYDKNNNRYNAAAIISNGELKGVYYKQNLPNYGVFDEQRYFKPGKKNKTFVLKGIPLAVNICEDVWVDDKTFKGQTDLTAKLVINISSSPFDIGKLEEREKNLTDKAKKHKLHIVYVNTVGGQDELVFDGGSLVINDKGKIVAGGKLFEEDLIVLDLDIKATKPRGKRVVLYSANNETTRKNLQKRKLQNLNLVERMHKAIVLGMRDYVNKNGFKKVVIGISGGIDSALVAAIATEAIGKENVVGVSMPSKFSSAGTKNDAKTLAHNLGIQYLEVPIDNVHQAYLENLKNIFKALPLDKTEENLQARIRGNILMALSNKFGWLVLTTGNKSEVAVGYCTLYGDMSGGYAVIKDIYKTKVYAIAEYFNKMKGKAIISRSIFERAPSAELKENQKDQDTLPPYDLLDEILVNYVEKHKSAKEIEKDLKNTDVIKKIIKMVDGSEYKRRQGPPGVRITRQSFDKDWRLPITNKYKEN